jgi:hypothetical protein
MLLLTPKSAFSLVLLAYLLPPHCYLHAADVLYETVYLVGPEPQPIALDMVDIPIDNSSAANGNGGLVNNTIKTPVPTGPIPEDSDGGRKLNAHRTLDSPDNLATPLHGVRSQHERGPAQFSRSLQGGGCQITNTVLGFNFAESLFPTGKARSPTNPHGAVGASRLVAVADSMMEIREKDGQIIFGIHLQKFFSAIPAAADSVNFFQPKVIYDEHEGRFVILALQEDGLQKISRIWLAVSKDETPQTFTDWNLNFIDSNSFVSDSHFVNPALEVDEEAVYISVNTVRFSDGGNAGAGVRLFWFDKGVSSGFYAGGLPRIHFTDPFATAGFVATTVPAQVHGSRGVDGSVGTFFVSAILKNGGQVDLQVYTLFDPLSIGNPSFTLQTVGLGIINQVGSLPDAPQLGSPILVGTSTVVALDAVWRNKKLWVVFSTNPPDGVDQNQATAHWVRLSTKKGVVTFDAQGNLGGEDIAPGAFTYFPSVAVNSQGTVAYGYSASSPETFVGAYASAGASEQSYTVRNGVALYDRIKSGSNAWGDYSAISVDPTDGSFWVFNQYADTLGTTDIGGFGRWATAWGRLECSVRNHIVVALNDVRS